MNNSIHLKRYALTAAACTLAASNAIIAMPEVWLIKFAASLVGAMFPGLLCAMVIPYHEDGSK